MYINQMSYAYNHSSNLKGVHIHKKEMVHLQTQQTFVTRWSFCLRRFEKLCLGTASLVERTRLAMHKQSFSNFLRQNGCSVTKDNNSGKFWIWIKEHSFHVSRVMVGYLLCPSQHLQLQKNTHKTSNPELHLQLGFISTSCSGALYKIPKWLSFWNEFCSRVKFVLH